MDFCGGVGKCICLFCLFVCLTREGDDGGKRKREKEGERERDRERESEREREREREREM